jgi:hypothetical protein
MHSRAHDKIQFVTNTNLWPWWYSISTFSSNVGESPSRFFEYLCKQGAYREWYPITITISIDLLNQREIVPRSSQSQENQKPKIAQTDFQPRISIPSDDLTIKPRQSPLQ